jgi:hypothetical protein
MWQLKKWKKWSEKEEKNVKRTTNSLTITKQTTNMLTNKYVKAYFISIVMYALAHLFINKVKHNITSKTHHKKQHNQQNSKFKTNMAKNFTIIVKCMHMTKN